MSFRRVTASLLAPALTFVALKASLPALAGVDSGTASFVATTLAVVIAAFMAGLDAASTPGQSHVVNVRALDEYKYKSGGYTPLDSLMNSWWLAVIELVPTSLAPNAITLLGLAGLAASGLTVAQYSSDFNAELPQWLHFFCAACLFWYQTMDAIDGKQVSADRHYCVAGSTE